MTTYKIAVSRYTLIKKLEPGDPAWHNFNAGFDNYELEPEKIAGAVYAGRAITTQHKNNWRVSENYLCGQHIGLDFDNGDSIPSLLQDKFISRYAAFLYTTISHTPELPKSRVVFLMDTPIMQAKNYALAAQSLLWLFGGADPKCKDPVRFFYGSKGCEMVIPGNVLPLEKVKRLIEQYLESGKQEKKRSDYHAPAEMKDVADALKVIPPWGIEYDEWVNILMGIHSQFGDAGFSLAESWADGKKNEVAIKWKSFDAGGNVAGAVTIATVFGIAKRFGWRRANG